MFRQRSTFRRLTPLFVFPILGLLIVFAIVFYHGRVEATGTIVSAATASPMDSFIGTPTGTSLATVVEQVDATPIVTGVSDTLVPIPADIAHHNTTGDPVTLRSVTGSPLISQQQAMAIVATQSPWGLGGNWEGKQVTVQAWYGLGSIGYADSRGNWLGSLNIPLPSGQILDHIENRPMWLIAYGNVPGIIASACWGCAPPPVYTHDVYAVDAQSRSIIWLASYPEP
jgi:hypothetical protein